MISSCSAAAGVAADVIDDAAVAVVAAGVAAAVAGTWPNKEKKPSPVLSSRRFVAEPSALISRARCRLSVAPATLHPNAIVARIMLDRTLHIMAANASDRK
jgi:hypothetical protein